MAQSVDKLELYKCALLTIIAIVLVALYVKIPVPFTLKNVESERVNIVDVPLVRIQGGHVGVE